MITADYHTHTNFSADSTAEMEDMILKAIELGLTRICFTEHMDYEYPDKYQMKFEFNPMQYDKKLNTLKDKYKAKIKVLKGIELGLMPHVNKRYETLLDFNDFDFVIGSSHLVNNVDPYYLEYWEGLEDNTSPSEALKIEREGYTNYFQTIIDNVKSFKRFNVYGHIDYVVRYGPNKNKNYSYTLYADILDEVFKTIINADKGIEVNTAGFKYGLNNPHPHADVLKRYKELGGELITIGSDAHSPEHLAYDFERARLMLLDIGFKYYAVFEKGKPIMLPLNS